jgi:hypothetical protein
MTRNEIRIFYPLHLCLIFRLGRLSRAGEGEQAVFGGEDYSVADDDG